MRVQKYKKSMHIPNDLSFFAAKDWCNKYYFETYNKLTRNKLLIISTNYYANINIISIFAEQKHSIHI